MNSEQEQNARDVALEMKLRDPAFREAEVELEQFLYAIAKSCLDNASDAEALRGCTRALKNTIEVTEQGFRI